MPKNKQWRFVPKNAGQHNAGNPPVRLQTNASSNMAWNPWLANVLAADKGVVLLQPESQTTSNDMSLDISKAIEDQLLAKPKVKACVDASYARWHAFGMVDIQQTFYTKIKDYRTSLMVALSAILGGNVKAKSDEYKAAIAAAKKMMNKIENNTVESGHVGYGKIASAPMSKYFAYFYVNTTLYNEEQGTKTTDSDDYVVINPNIDNALGGYKEKIEQAGSSWPEARKWILTVALTWYKEWLDQKALLTQATNALGNLKSFDVVYNQLINLGYKGEKQYAKLKNWTGNLDPNDTSIVVVPVPGAPLGSSDEVKYNQMPPPEDGPYNKVYKRHQKLIAAKAAYKKTLITSKIECQELPWSLNEWAATLGCAKAKGAIAKLKSELGLQALVIVEKYLAETHKLAKMLYGNKCAVDLAQPDMTIEKMEEIIVNCAKNPEPGSYLYKFQTAKDQLMWAQGSALTACEVPDEDWPKLPMDPKAFNALPAMIACASTGKGAQQRASRSRFTRRYYKAKTDVEGLIEDRQEARAEVVNARTEVGGTYNRADDAKTRVKDAEEVFNAKPVQVGEDSNGNPIMAGYPRSEEDKKNLDDAKAAADYVIERSNEAGAAIVAYGMGLKIAIEDNELDNDPNASDNTAEEACAALKAQGAKCPGEVDKPSGGGWMAIVLAAAAAAASGAIG